MASSFFEAFLGDFPDGYFSARARSRLTAMEKARRSEAERIAAKEAARKAAEHEAAATEEARRKTAVAEEAQRKAASEEVERRATELAFWESVRGSTHPADYQAYLEAYPNGQFAALARVRAAKKPPTEVAALAPQPADASPQQVVPLTSFDGRWRGAIKEWSGPAASFHCPLNAKFDMEISNGKISGKYRAAPSSANFFRGSVNKFGGFSVSFGEYSLTNVKGSLSAETGKGSAILTTSNCTSTAILKFSRAQ